MNLTSILVGALLILVQALAALPWAAAGFLTGGGRSPAGRSSGGQRLVTALLIVVGAAVVSAVFGFAVQDRETLEVCGRGYGAVLQMQLTVDFFVLAFALLLAVWPKGGAVALAAFREGVRQPMYWLLTGLALLLMTASPFVPYFTFGEDHIMVKELGYDTIMLLAVVF